MRSLVVAAAVCLVLACSVLASEPLSLDSERFLFATENVYEHTNTHWVRSAEPVGDDERVSFRLYLKQRNLDILEQELLRTSDPRSAVYGNWWDQERITSLIAPPLRIRSRIIRTLERFGIDKIVDVGDVIKCTASAARVAALFDTTFAAFVNEANNIRILRQVGAYSLPTRIAEHVEFISGITAFPPPPRRKHFREPYLKDVSPDDNQTGKVVSYVIAQDYGMPLYPNYATNANSSICLAEFQNDRSFSATDLSTFQTQNALPNVPVTHIVGPYQPSIPDAEATLDVQYGGAVAINATVWFWTVDGWLLEFANDFYNTNPVPFVVSMSWGWPEDAQCQITSCNGYTSQQYVQRTNTEWQKIGLRGVTLLASSGDQGAPGDSNPYCVNSAEPISTIFPGASPWVTSVGATMFVPPSTNARLESDAAPPICSQFDCADPTWPEVACSFPNALITSGGGFSDYSARPAYQSKEVATYLGSAIGLPPAQYFNSTNRGFPDISALGHNYLIYLSGRWSLVDGTSCSSPVIGGMVALWNDWLFNNNFSPLGFINPLLYQMFEADPTNYKDITSGNNKCTEAKCCQYGFPTATGWDAVTGLGAPNYAKMMAYIQANPPKPAPKN